MNYILFFVRWPESGKVKTRLASTLGYEEALRIHTLLAEKCFENAREVSNAKLIVCGTGAVPEKFRSWLHGADDYWEQPTVGLGERLSALFNRAFQENAATVCAIGSDAPNLDAEGISEAIQHFEKAPVSILPATDGGYVLIGLCRMIPQIFENISWGTDRVLEETKKVCEDQNLSYYIGKQYRDVDFEADWKSISRDLTR